nr:MAG TPA: hypothetical protein [Siphoviridae sp. ctYuc6]
MSYNINKKFARRELTTEGRPLGNGNFREVRVVCVLETIITIIRCSVNFGLLISRIHKNGR